MRSITSPAEELSSERSGLLERPWTLILFIVIGLMIGALAIATDFNPTNGAKGDFERYHYVTVQMFHELSFADFLLRMHTASGPFFYVLAGGLELSPLATRSLALALHMGTSIIFFILTRARGASSIQSLTLGSALFLSPFQLGPALWGHPETLALFILASCALLIHNKYSEVSRWIMPLSVGVRQTALAGVLVSAVQDLISSGKLTSPIIKIGTSTALVLIFMMAWGGLTPPGFQYYSVPSTRTFFVSFFLMTLAIYGSRINIHNFRKIKIIQTAIITNAVTVPLYLWGPPFFGGGFIFSRLDTFCTGFDYTPLLSPLIIGTTLGIYAKTLRDEPVGTVAVAICSLLSASSNILYVKYVDFSIWSVLLLGSIHGKNQRITHPSSLTLSLTLWSALNMLMALLTYR